MPKLLALELIIALLLHALLFSRDLHERLLLNVFDMLLVGLAVPSVVLLEHFLVARLALALLLHLVKQTLRVLLVLVFVELHDLLVAVSFCLDELIDLLLREQVPGASVLSEVLRPQNLRDLAVRYS